MLPRASQTNQLEDRQVAGLLLKNNVARSWPSTAAAQQSYIKACVMSTLASPHRSLRAATGTAVSAIAAASSLPEWPELVMGLAAALDSNQPDAVDGALDALEKICEEARDARNISLRLPQSPFTFWLHPHHLTYSAPAFVPLLSLRQQQRL